MTITYETLYTSNTEYRLTVKCERLGRSRNIRLLCPGSQYLDTVREILKQRGFTIIDYDLC